MARFGKVRLPPRLCRLSPFANGRPLTVAHCRAMVPVMKHHILWLAPAVTCIVAMVAYFALEPDAFVIGLFLLVPISLLASLVFGLIALRNKSIVAGSTVACALSLSFIVPTLLMFGAPLRDAVFFTIWSQSHRQEKREAERSDGVLQHWDSWGSAATIENDSFLVSDADDALSAAVAPHRSPVLPEPQASIAARWGRLHHLRCDIVWVHRMQRGFYVLTTVDGCVL